MALVLAAAAFAFACSLLFYDGMAHVPVWFWAAIQAAMISVLLLPALALWHMFDLLDNKVCAQNAIRFASSVYPIWIITSAYGLVFGLIATDRFLTEVPCGGSFNFLTQACVGAISQLQVPADILAFAFIVLVALKAWLSVRSRFRTSQ